MFNIPCCLLCLENSNDQIELDSKEGLSLCSREVIELHFKELIMMIHIEKKVVCQKCWRLVQSFHEFYLNVQRAHKEAADALKNVSFENDDLEIKEELECKDEDKSAPLRRSRRPKRKKKEDIIDASCDTNLPLIECQVKIEELMQPATTVDDSIRPQQTGIASPTSDVKEEDSDNEYIMDITQHTDGSDSDEMEMSEDDNKVRKRRSVKSHQRKRINKKTAELDEYIAKKDFKLTCCICNNPMSNFKSLKIHFREQHQTNGYVPCCGKKLYRLCLLIDHIHLHEDPDYFKCEQCGKRMSTRRSLEVHLEQGHGERERVHQCSICSKRFFRVECLKQHYSTHVKEDEKNVPCSQCKKTFADHIKLREHIRHTHSNAYAKICDICGAAIKGRDAFERHQAEHAGVPQQRLKCDLCDVVIKTKYGLTRHMKTQHTKEYQTPQVCPICSKVSPTLRAHKCHMFYMHTEKRHICKLCDKAFKQPQSLREHMTTHTGGVLYTCTFCPKTFNSHSNMYAHRKRKHPIEWAEKCAKKNILPGKEQLNLNETK